MYVYTIYNVHVATIPKKKKYNTKATEYCFIFNKDNA